MKFTDLKQHIGAKQFLPCYAVLGDDEYLVKKAIDMFSDIIELKELNISVLPSDAPVDAVLAAVETLPFGFSHRLVIADSRHFAALSKYLKQPLDTTIVLIRAEKGFKASGIEAVDCDRLSVEILKSSIAAECKKNATAVTSDAAALIIEYCQRYMGRIRGEIYKLIDYKAGDTITADDVRIMVKPDPEYRVFELSDAIIKKDGEKAYRLLDDMLSDGYGSAVKVFGLLYSHFKRLMAVSLDASGCAEYMDIKGYALTASINQSKAFSKVKLKGILDRLHKLDLGIKTGLIGDKIGLNTFVAEAISEVN